MHLSEKLCTAVQVYGVWRIVLCIVAAIATEYAVSAEVNQFGLTRSRQLCKLMRQQRVNRNRGYRVASRLGLFNDADAVQNDTGTPIIDGIGDRLQMFGLDIAVQFCIGKHLLQIGIWSSGLDRASYVERSAKVLYEFVT
jgi:hypothetical protein